ncbi:MAG: hypothetical protein ACI8YB_000653 [Patiriisocius sp.]|jgi:hypothetical protein
MTGSTQAKKSFGSVLTEGLLSILLVLVISAACIAPFDHDTFVDWVGLAFLAATATQVILGLLWDNNKPEAVGQLSQPAKGLALTSITILMGAIVFALVMYLVGGGHGSSPMVTQYFIMSVVVVIWVVSIWECWPLTLLSKDPVIIGVLTLIYAYLLAYVLWTIFFDYSILGQMGQPDYHEDIDPKGLFGMWTAAIFFVTAVGIIVVHFLFDLWPIDKLTKGAKQPFRGLIATLYILALTWLVQTIFIGALGMAPVEYMVRVPVCMIFGTFLVSNMMQFSLFSDRQQPIKGLLLLVCAVVAAMLVYELYRWASVLHTGGELATGPSGGFAQEIWIASAMLGVTFPIIFMVSGFFGFWPILRTDDQSIADQKR